SFHWQLRFFPRFPTARNIPKLSKSLTFQNARSDARAITAPAVNGRWLIAIKLTDSLPKLRYVEVTRAGHMTLFPFAGGAHVKHLQRRLSVVQLVDAHLPDSFERKPCRVPRFHSANQIAGKFRVTSADKQTHDSFKIVVILDDKQNRLFRIEHPARPN